jgi:hypothetical protein
MSYLPELRQGGRCEDGSAAGKLIGWVAGLAAGAALILGAASYLENEKGEAYPWENDSPGVEQGGQAPGWSPDVPLFPPGFNEQPNNDEPQTGDESQDIEGPPTCLEEGVQGPQQPGCVGGSPDDPRLDSNQPEYVEPAPSQEETEANTEPPTTEAPQSDAETEEYVGPSTCLGEGVQGPQQPGCVGGSPNDSRLDSSDSGGVSSGSSGSSAPAPTQNPVQRPDYSITEPRINKHGGVGVQPYGPPAP